MTRGPLQGIRIIDLTRLLSGPFATQILADLGADVIKVEPPGGDKARQNAPLVQGESTYFASLNRGKKSLVLDLKRESARGVFRRLIAGADALVENFRPGVMARLGLGQEALRVLNPRLVYVACSGFGQTGPESARPALDAVIQAMAGSMSITGAEGLGPARVGFSVGDLGGGLYTAVAVLAGLAGRHTTGQALTFDVSMLDAQVALLENAYARYFATGEVPERLGTRHPVLVPFQAFDTRDRQIVIAVSTEAHWQALLVALGLEELAAHPHYQTARARLQHHRELVGVLASRLRERGAEEWMDRLESAGVPCGPVNRIDEAAREPQLQSRGMFREVRGEQARFMVAGPPYQVDGKPVAVSSRVPALGEHSRAILEELGYGAEAISQLAAEGSVGLWPAK
jgi:CoA:oxalate CoA-transferase